MGNLF